ncbi:MAG: hypothetical protein KatS3mg102_0792 [Planctomycetota bacterium]|nr:MAG: hypothetical protein KatS3mg102_0792 [Planctomycetota bacterium]
MPTYFMFGRYTTEAIKGIAAERTERAGEAIRKAGGEVQSIHALLGERDLCIIATFPNGQAALRASLALTRLTGIGFATSEAVPVATFDRLAEEVLADVQG